MLNKRNDERLKIKERKYLSIWGGEKKENQLGCGGCEERWGGSEEGKSKIFKEGCGGVRSRPVTIYQSD